MKYFKIYLKTTAENSMVIGAFFEKEGVFEIEMVSIDKIPADAKLKTSEREDLEKKIAKIKSAIASVKHKFNSSNIKDIEQAQLLDIFEKSELSSGEIMNCTFPDFATAKTAILG